MAIQTVRVCDVCKAFDADADPKLASDSVTLEWNGQVRAYDVCDDHAGKLTAFLESGTRSGITAKPKKAAPSKRTAPKPEGSQAFSPAAIREWAEAEGKKVPKRGPIPAELVVEYKHAQI